MARSPNLIEKDLKDLTEEYTGNDDITTIVITRATNPVKNKIVEASGTMRSKGRNSQGQLQVAYFLPIFLDFNVLDIYDDYQYALVAGSSMNLSLVETTLYSESNRTWV